MIYNFFSIFQSIVEARKEVMIYAGMTDPYILAESEKVAKNISKIAQIVKDRNPENVFRVQKIFFHPLTGSSEVSIRRCFICSYKKEQR